MNKKELMESFYEAFSKGDWKTMNSFYADNTTFTDSIFKGLNHEQVTAMWKMLLENNEDMSVEFTIIEDNDDFKVNWIVTYKFGPKRRKVINSVLASFEIENDKIVKHKDEFNFYKWSKQSLGLVGFLFGWTKWFNKKVGVGALEKINSNIK
ncbi:nuclear transport factor 2 family protein [[Acholeplasma] multilocale]|uniref:nuclear transport factor 2 family protein n=1 Tax=[Acholeplasma] multilocale TaxID=264638 RepID=UPI00047EDEFD|nr:nuclear transport factor 2 family protein [[Acholeplasma] multilocale]